MTVPNNSRPDESNSQKPVGTPPESIIQPGQYAIAGGDGVFKEPPAPTGAGNSNQVPSAPQAPMPQPTVPQPPPPVVTQQAPSYSENQPNPTPYVPPQGQGIPENSSPSGIRKMRLVIMVAGLLLLIVLIAALAWFLVLSKNHNASQKAQTEENKIELPTPQPQRTTGGFSEIPPATDGAQQATSGAVQP